MTAVQTPSAVWSAMPGWGISANLLPPEIIASRRLRVLRRWFVAVLAGVLVLCGAGYAYALTQQGAARRGVQSEQARTGQLQGQRRSYADVTRLQGSITQVQARLATLMTDDVDLSGLVGELAVAAPRGVTISQLAVTIDGVSTKGRAKTSADAGVLDTSGTKHIGSIAMTANAPNLLVSAAYVDRLRGVPGLVEVYPTSATQAETGTQFTLQIILSTALRSHKFDVSTKAVK